MVRVKPEDQPTDNPDVKDESVVEETVVADEPVAAPQKTRKTAARTPAQKAARKRKAAASTRKRRKPAAKPVTEPVLTIGEAKEKIVATKDELIGAVSEPVARALGRYSQMARDGLSGLVSGFLGNKRRD